MRKLHKVGIDMRREELIALFDMLDIDDIGVLSIETFVDGFARAQDALSMKHMLMLEHMFKRMEIKVQNNAEKLEQVVSLVQAPAPAPQHPGIAELCKMVELLAQQVQTLAQQQQTLVQDQASVSS